MDDYISREEAITAACEGADIGQGKGNIGRNYCIRTAIKKTPAADVQPVVRGQWEWFEDWSQSTTEHPSECEDCGWRCGRCKNTLENMVGGYWDDLQKKPKLKFCPNCGADMRGGPHES